MGLIYGDDYDRRDPISIEKYAQGLKGKSFSEVCKEDSGGKYITGNIEDYEYNHENKKRKGGLGELIEERYFHYKANNDSDPDFDEAGVELKVTPYKINKKGDVSAKERLVITMIDYENVVKESFFESHLWKKAQLILLVYYLYEKDIKCRLEYKIGYTKLFTPPKEDLKIIMRDFEVIKKKIKDGKAHELSESDTFYLGAAPKAASSKNTRKQPFSDIPAKPRAFVYKNSYMTYVLRNYIISDKNTYEPIVKEDTDKPFEKYINEKISAYKDWSVQSLCTKFKINFDKPCKNLEAILVYRILGIKGNKAAEFEKANIVVKTIRINNKNKIKESMSFPTFKFSEIIQEEWETSTFREYLSETKFFFVIYKMDENNILRLKGCQFWNIPYEDLEQVHDVWSKTVQVVKDGITTTRVGNRLQNNFPKKIDNPVCHVRPHGRDRDDTYELPNGSRYTKQCFWLNNDYILSQLNRSILGEI